MSIKKGSLGDLSAIILCSGISKRFGSNKLIADLHGKPVLWYVISHVQKSGINDVYLVTNPEILSELEAYFPNENYIINKNYNYGMSSSVVSAVKKLRYDFSRILIINGDQPFFNATLIKALISTQDSHPENIVSASYMGSPRNPAVFPHEFYGELLLLRGDTGAKSLIHDNTTKVSLVEVGDETYLFDIDTRYDYEKAKTIPLSYLDS
ncbi:MAG: nucleotidyltransferase family protein [Candidatus Thermoplasmatota archaeon]|jgi:molybdenum cofactor cytidylyltransferase|nr:nucleotidyltransferase family protein [Candidatus Thermoplasmatota archaeon]